MNYEIISDSVRSLVGVFYEGNVIPHEWKRFIVYANGRPNPVAQLVLSELLYWHRPITELDPETGEPHYFQRFKGKRLQKSYAQLEKSLGFSEKQCKDAMKCLEELGLVKRFSCFEELASGAKVKTLYIELNAENVIKISTPKIKLNVSIKTSSTLSKVRTRQTKVQVSTTTDITTDIYLPPIPPQGGDGKFESVLTDTGETYKEEENGENVNVDLENPEMSKNVESSNPPVPPAPLYKRIRKPTLSNAEKVAKLEQFDPNDDWLIQVGHSVSKDLSLGVIREIFKEWKFFWLDPGEKYKPVTNFASSFRNKIVSVVSKGFLEKYESLARQNKPLPYPTGETELERVLRLTREQREYQEQQRKLTTYV